MDQPTSEAVRMWCIRYCVAGIAWWWPIDLQKWDMLLAMFYTLGVALLITASQPPGHSIAFKCRPAEEEKERTETERYTLHGKRLLLLAIWIVFKEN